MESGKKKKNQNKRIDVVRFVDIYNADLHAYNNHDNYCNNIA